MNRIKFIGFIAILIFLVGCKSSRDLQSPRMVNLYEENPVDVTFQYQLFHFSGDSSRIFISINTKNLLYARHGDSKPTASVIVKIKDENNDKILRTFRLADADPDKVAKTLVAHADLYLPKGETTSLRITITDENRSRSVERKIKSDKSNVFNRQNFLIVDGNNEIPLFTDRVKPLETYKILVNEDIDSPLTVRYYNRIFSMPPPPFIVYARKPFDYDADSYDELDVIEHSVKINTKKDGFYHFTAGNETKDGVTLFISDPEFPSLTTEDDLMRPLRYILTTKEYDRINAAEDKKKLLEELWLSWAGSKDRARKSIKAYYNRVERANVYFSSHVEGWKSDRGMIYIVYGTPDRVYRTEEVETWLYGPEENPMSIRFYFVRVINPFTDNDYQLNREEIYKPSWYRSANAWRDGRIF